MPVFALVVAVVGAVAGPLSLGDVVLCAIPVAAFGLWVWVPGVPLVLVAVAVLVPVVVVQRSGGHEPLMFEASVLAFVVARWSGSLAGGGRAWAACGRFTGRGERDRDRWQHLGRYLGSRDCFPVGDRPRDLAPGEAGRSVGGRAT